MKLKRVFFCAAVVATFGLASAEAASLRRADEPAEFPPASYKGRQYVDSRGCVYIRAGIDGNVNWIPRVTRGREHICGAKPTFANAPAAAAPRATARASEPVEIIVPQTPSPTARVAKPVATPAARTTTARTTTARTTTVATAPAARPATAPKFTLGSLFAPQPQQQRVRLGNPVSNDPVTARRVAPAARVVAPVAAPVVAQSPCQGASAVSQRYLGTGAGVRCGPQAEPPVPYVTTTGRPVVVTQPSVAARTVVTAPAQTRRVTVATPVTTISPNARVVPRHVYVQQQNARIAQPVPKGYRPVWTDDRLNPKRAHQTLAGKAQMDLIWSQTVPRVLLDRTTGQDVSRYHPNLRYPYTDLTTQIRADMGQVQVKTQTAVRAAPIVASKSRQVAKSAPKAQASGRSYVQVASFANGANAQTTARRLAASGLPMRIWTTKRNGRPLQLVVAGPFADAASASAALRRVQRAGFSDAYLRR